MRAQGAQLGGAKHEQLSADVGTVGVRAGGAAEVSETLEKRYAASDAAMLEIVHRCNEASGASLDGNGSAAAEAAGSLADMSFEADTDRRGDDYGHFDVNGDGYESCRDACLRDDRCQALTFRPSDGLCWLKAGGGTRMTIPGLISAEKLVVTIPDGIGLNPNMDRPGHDFRDFVPRTGRVAECIENCQQDANCRAFTFRKPSPAAPSGHCWLKNAPGSPISDPRFVSGARH